MTVARCTACDWRTDGDERPVLQASHRHANSEGHAVELDQGRTIRPLQPTGGSEPGEMRYVTTARGFASIADSEHATEEALRRTLRAAAERVTEAVLASRATRVALEKVVEDWVTKPGDLTPREVADNYVKEARRRLQKEGRGTDG